MGRSVLVLALAAAAVAVAAAWSRSAAKTLVAPLSPVRKTIADRLAEYGPSARGRMARDFALAGVPYPPAQVVLVGLKHERLLEVWGGASGDRLRHIRNYPILGQSGTLGPKLRRGDRQVPEGLYRVESLNPNSRYHLSLRLNYPNDFDRDRGNSDGRADLGSDIMIHGGRCSIGCLAMGDQAAEDLFVLAADTGTTNVSVILSPVDFRIRGLPPDGPPLPAWTSELYRAIGGELAARTP